MPCHTWGLSHWVVKLWKIFMPAQNVLFLRKDRLAFGLWRWCLFLVLMLCIEEFVWKKSWLLIMNLINESIYWHGTGRVSSCLNRLLHEFLHCAPAIILIILFYKVTYVTCQLLHIATLFLNWLYCLLTFTFYCWK